MKVAIKVERQGSNVPSFIIQYSTYKSEKDTYHVTLHQNLSRSFQVIGNFLPRWKVTEI